MNLIISFAAPLGGFPDQKENSLEVTETPASINILPFSFCFHFPIGKKGF